MSSTKMIYDNSGKIYAIGTSKECNKIYDKIKLSYPDKKIFIGDAEKQKRRDCVGAKQSVSFTPVRK